MRKYLLPILLIGYLGCEKEQESIVNGDYVGNWIVSYQGTYENSNCTGQITEGPKVGYCEVLGLIDSVYTRSAPMIELTDRGRFLFKHSCYGCSETTSITDITEGPWFDVDGDSLIGNYDSLGNYSPGNDYNVNGDRETINCDNQFSYKDAPCELGNWTSEDNIISLSFDEVGHSLNYIIEQEGDDLLLRINNIYNENGILLSEYAEYSCEMIIRKKVND